jgi:hypothetical protein
MKIWNETILCSQPYEDAVSISHFREYLSTALLSDKLCICPLLIYVFWNPLFLSERRELRKQRAVNDHLPPSAQCFLSIPHMNKKTRTDTSFNKSPPS